MRWDIERIRDMDYFTNRALCRANLAAEFDNAHALCGLRGRLRRGFRVLHSVGNEVCESRLAARLGPGHENFDLGDLGHAATAGLVTIKMSKTDGSTARWSQTKQALAV